MSLPPSPARTTVLALWVIFALAGCEEDRPAAVGPSAAESASPSTDRSDEARAHYERGRKLVSDANIKLGYRTYDHSLLDQGIAELGRAVAIEPADFEFQYWLGRAHHLRNDLDAALEHFREAAAIDPSRAEAQHWIGSIHLLRGELDAADAALHRALDLDPDDPLLLTDLGALAEERDDLETARRHYARAIELKQSSSTPHFRLGNLLHRLGQAEAAEREIGRFEHWLAIEQELDNAYRVARERSGDADALTDVAVRLFELEDREQAFAWIERALSADPFHGRANLYRGMLAYEAGDLASAGAHLERSIAAVPDDALAHRGLAWVLFHRGDVAGARARMARSVELAGDDAGAHVEQALLHRESAEPELAIRALERAIAIDPASIDARLLLGEVLFGQGKRSEAAVQYRKVLEIDPGHEGASRSLEFLTREEQR